METTIAEELSDAFVHSGHPRLDFRTEEGRKFAMRCAPYLSGYIHKGMRAIDLGCGTGKSSFLLSEFGAWVTGIDASYKALAYAKGIAQSIHAEVVCVQGDYAGLPFHPCSFDVAFFPNNIVECSPKEFRMVIMKANRVLRNKGYFLMTVSHKWSGGNPECRPVRRDGIAEVPGVGTFEYPTYTWSVQEVSRLVNGYFSL